MAHICFEEQVLRVANWRHAQLHSVHSKWLHLKEQSEFMEERRPKNQVMKLICFRVALHVEVSEKHEVSGFEESYDATRRRAGKDGQSSEVGELRGEEEIAEHSENTMKAKDQSHECEALNTNETRTDAEIGGS